MSPPPAADGSPFSLPMSGHFSEEDIHELLGAMGDHASHPSLDQLAATHHHHLEEEAVVSMSQNPGSSDETRVTSAANSESNEQEEEDEEAISAEARAQARSERKRSREKQRRLDVNKQFADLTQLLRRIEAEDLDAEGMAGLGSIPSGGPTNRVDLIARTIAVLERMHEMSCKRRREVIDLTRQLEDMKKMAEDTAARLKEATVYQQGPPKPVMMMVPMMVNPGAAAAPGATPGFPFVSPFMQQAQPQMFMPQMAPVTAPVAGATEAANAMTAPNVMATTQVPQQQATQVPQQQQQQHQPVVMPQQPVVFPTPQVMFGGGTPSPTPPASTTAQPSSPHQQGQQKQPPANVNGGGGNLAHCA